MAELPQLTWKMGDLHTFTNDSAGSHPVNILTALSQSVVSASYWKVVGSNIDSGSFPSLIVAPTSTSASYTHMRIVFITGDAARGTNAEGPHLSDMATNAVWASNTWNNYDPMLYVGIAPFGGLAAAPNHIVTASGGDWRHGTGGGIVYPEVARFSGWVSAHAAANGTHQLKGGGGGLYLIENEEMLFMQVSEGYESHSRNENGLMMAGAMYVPYAASHKGPAHSASSADAGRVFGIAGGSNVGASTYTPFRTSNDPITDLATDSDEKFWPGGDNDTSDAYGNKHYCYHSGSGAWIQLATVKMYNQFISDNWAAAQNPWRDDDDQHVLLPMHVFGCEEPCVAIGYWRQMTQCAGTYTRKIMRGPDGAVKGFCIQKPIANTFTGPGYFLHNDKTFT